MNDLQIFNFDNKEVRTVTKDDKPFWIAGDICSILGMKNSRQALKHLDTDEKDVILNDTLGGDQQMAIVNESGLYALIMRSRKPQAKKFRKWVTSEVLPQIRKTGSYSTNKIDPIMAMLEVSTSMRKIQIGHESRISQIEDKLENRQNFLIAPPMTDRMRINQVVRKYAIKKGIYVGGAWKMLYDDLLYRLRINVTLQAKNQNIAVIDFLENNGYLPDALAVALEMFGE